MNFFFGKCIFGMVPAKIVGYWCNLLAIVAVCNFWFANQFKIRCVANILKIQEIRKKKRWTEKTNFLMQIACILGKLNFENITPDKNRRFSIDFGHLHLATAIAMNCIFAISNGYYVLFFGTSQQFSIVFHFNTKCANFRSVCVECNFCLLKHTANELTTILPIKSPSFQISIKQHTKKQ